MKKTITQFFLLTASAFAISTSAQVSVETFDTFTLSPNSHYENKTVNDWDTPSAKFRYQWDAGFDYWSAGTAYSNTKDTIDGTFSNLYGNITNAGFSGNNYAVIQGGATVVIKNLSVLSGFYITNTTYAWKTIKNGNQFSRKFGDTTGTGSGNTIPQGHYPDWFKLVVNGYRGGVLLTDSVEFYLADYRAAGITDDYTIKNWQFVNCASLGIVDSVTFNFKTSDVGAFGMNTPAFASIDNFTTNSTVSVVENSFIKQVSFFPNPAAENINMSFTLDKSTSLNLSIIDVTGKQVKNIENYFDAGKNTLSIDLLDLPRGVYFIKENTSIIPSFKFIKD